MNSVLETIRRLRHTVVPLPLKYGRRFRQVFGFLIKHQHAGRDEIEHYQWRRLKDLLDYAYEHVPFYHERFAKAGLHPDDIKTRDDFAQLPQLTRVEIEQHSESLKSDEFKKQRPILSLTSGTTHDRLSIYRSRETEIWRKAVVWRHFVNLGYHFREPRVQITMPLKFLKSCQEMPVDYSENALLIDPRSICRECCRTIHERVQRFAPKLIFSQPANLSALVDHFRSENLPSWPAKLIVLLGEKVYPEYRETITSYFDVPIREYYGNRENTVAATELDDGNLYIQSDYCYLEFVDEAGRAVENESANIISTSLVNYAFPLIRYQTEDVGIFRGHVDGERQPFPTMEILGGRGKDLILTRDGLVSCYEMFSVEKLGHKKLKRAQLEQVSLDEIIVRVVPKSDFVDPDDRLAVQRAYEQELPGDFRVRVELVAEISSTDCCKNRLVISDLALNSLRSKQVMR